MTVWKDYGANTATAWNAPKQNNAPPALNTNANNNVTINKNTPVQSQTGHPHMNIKQQMKNTNNQQDPNTPPLTPYPRDEESRNCHSLTIQLPTKPNISVTPSSPTTPSSAAVGLTSPTLSSSQSQMHGLTTPNVNPTSPTDQMLSQIPGTSTMLVSDALSSKFSAHPTPVHHLTTSARAQTVNKKKGVQPTVKEETNEEIEEHDKENDQPSNDAVSDKKGELDMRVNQEVDEDEEERDFIAPIRKDSRPTNDNVELKHWEKQNGKLSPSVNSPSLENHHHHHPSHSQNQTGVSQNNGNATISGIQWNNIWNREKQQQQLQMQMGRLDIEVTPSSSGVSTGLSTPTQESSEVHEITRGHPGTIPPPSSPYMANQLSGANVERKHNDVHDHLSAHRRASYTSGATAVGAYVAERALLQAEGIPFRGRRFSYSPTVYDHLDSTHNKPIGTSGLAEEAHLRHHKENHEYEPHSIRRHSISTMNPNMMHNSQSPSYHCPPLTEEELLYQMDDHMSRMELDDGRSLNPNAAVFGPQSYPEGFLDEVDGYFDGDESRARAWADPSRQNSFQQAMYHGPLYIVEFKGGRTDLFYVPEIAGITVKQGDLVIVEADRGKDLGKVVKDSITHSSQLLAFPEFLENAHLLNKDLHPKRIYHLAQPQEVSMLVAKAQDEAKSMAVCQAKVRQKKLPMEVVDGEYQWDRRKLTFYFVAERRIDFRELVRDLFKIYKTRIWMCAVDRNRLLPKQTRYPDPYHVGVDPLTFM